MNRFLDNLAARLLNPAEAIQPRTPSRFEPESAASPRPFSAPETTWEDGGGLEQGEPQAPESVRPEQGSPRRSPARRAPAAPLSPAARPDDAAAPMVLPPPVPRRVDADDSQALALAARPPASTEPTAPESPLPALGRTRTTVGAEALRPPTPSAPPTSPARGALDEEPPRGAMPRTRTVTPTDGPVVEAARRQQAASPTPMLGAAQGVPISPEARRAGEQPLEGTVETVGAQVGGRAPLSSVSPAVPPVPDDPMPAFAPAASNEAAAAPGGALLVETVTLIQRGQDAPPPETAERRPAVTVRAASAPAVKPSEPTAPGAQRETPPPVPTIQVTIGRIEVRAAAPAPRTSNARPVPPRLTLEEFLRDGGRK